MSFANIDTNENRIRNNMQLDPKSKLLSVTLRLRGRIMIPNNKGKSWLHIKNMLHHYPYVEDYLYISISYHPQIGPQLGEMIADGYKV